jgi:hypothetical protein
MAADADGGRTELLRWTAGLGPVSAEALAGRDCGVSRQSARARLAAAERAGQMRSWRLLRGEPALYTVTRAGLRAAGAPDLAPASVSAAGAAHAGACARVAASLETAYPGHAVLGEPALRAAVRAGELRLPAPRLPGRPAGAPRSHRPDLVLVPQEARDRLPVAVEVELTVKSPERLEAICVAWARERTIGGVLYFAAAPVRAPLERAISRAGAEGRIVVVAM